MRSPNNEFWDVKKKGIKIGKVTSAVYSPRLKKNIALAIINKDHAQIGTYFEIKLNDKTIRCLQVSIPFYDPKKRLAKQ